MKAFIGRKIGMTSTINEDGAVKALTVLAVEPNTVTAIRTMDTNGYAAVQLATGKKRLSKAVLSQFKSSKLSPKHVKEFRLSVPDTAPEVGKTLHVDEVFEVGDVVKVTATSKGKGFAGTIKRHGFHRGRKTHGGRSYRRPGSIGSMYPQKIFKGKKMSGQMGSSQVTVRNLRVELIDRDLGIIGLSGAVPGPRKGLVFVRGQES